MAPRLPARKKRPETPARHIARLCRELGIKRTIDPGRGHANVRKRQIHHQPLRTEMAYFVALHEIGHIVVGLGDYRLDREAKAWKWALENALFPPHYSTRQRICSLMVRYFYRAHQNGWKIPPEGHFYWRLWHWW